MADDNGNVIIGTAAGEVINGLGGPDTIDGAGGADILIGGSGDDTFRMTGAMVDGGESVEGGLSRRRDSGIDTLDLSGITFQGIVDNPELGTVTVGNFVDLANGTFGSSYGFETLDGAWGFSQSVARVRHVENVIGSAFADNIAGNYQENLIRGGDGDDIINGGDGEDRLFGEGGNDTFKISGDIYATGLDHIDGGTGRNAIDASGLTNANAAAHLDLVAGTLSMSYQDQNQGGATGGSPRITNVQDFVGGDGWDSVVASAEANRIDGGRADDTVSYQHSTAGVNVDLPAGTATGGYAEGDTLIDMEGVIGSAFADRITAEYATGGGGADTFVGYNEYIYDFRPAEGDKIDLAALGDVLGKPIYGLSDLTWTWDATHGSWDLAVNGTPLSMNVTMPDGEPTFTESMFVFTPAPATEAIAGTEGHDNLTGTGGPDTLIGYGGNDWLKGGAGADTIDGGEGDDWIEGQGGADVLSGGGGTDYVFIEADFQSANGGDGWDALIAGDSFTAGGLHFAVAGSGFEFVAGRYGNDVVDGSGVTYNMSFSAYAGDDTFKNGEGSDVFWGGEGHDTMAFAKNQADYTITHFYGDTWRVTDNATGALDQIVGAEQLQFADSSLVIA